MNTDSFTHRLREGDRIQLTRPIAGVAMGTEGTILRRFAFDSFYDVCFDGYPLPRLITTRDLAPAEENDHMSE
jgi:hypothetical protein